MHNPNMDLDRPSNHGTLISAVLVGLLALASTQYARMEPEDVNRFSTRVASYFEREEETPIVLTPATLRPRIRLAESDLRQLLARWQQSIIPDDDPRIGEALNQVEFWLNQLDTNNELREGISSAERLSITSILFMASQFDPPRFEQRFERWMDDMLNLGDVSFKSSVAAIKFYHEHNLQESVKPTLLKDLAAFSEKYPESKVGVNLYATVARDLYRSGYAKLSRGVLNQGIKVYGESRDTLPLVNQRIDQELLLPQGY